MDERYPINICDVVKQNLSPNRRACQFSWFCDGRSDVPYESDAWRESLQLAAAVLNRDSTIADPTEGAMWYHARRVRPAWARQLSKVKAIGGHVFYRDRDYHPPVVQVGWGTKLRRILIGGNASRFAEWRDSLRHATQLAQN